MHSKEPRERHSWLTWHMTPLFLTSSLSHTHVFLLPVQCHPISPIRSSRDRSEINCLRLPVHSREPRGRGTQDWRHHCCWQVHWSILTSFYYRHGPTLFHGPEHPGIDQKWIWKEDCGRCFSRRLWSLFLIFRVFREDADSPLNDVNSKPSIGDKNS
jgi:hypothetical protein